MNIEEIIKGIERVNRKYSASVMGLPDAGECEDIAALCAAIALLRTHPGSQPNDPLTLDELREMDGEPVWIEWGGHPQAGWALVRVWSKASNTVYLTYHNGNTDLIHFVLNDGGEIYRRKPEEGT